MEEINFEYILTQEEFLSFNKIMTAPGFRRRNIFVLILCSVVCAASCFYIGKPDVFVIVSWALAFSAAAFISRLAMHRSVKSAYAKSNRLKKPRRILFFNDHIETFLCHGRENSGMSISHYPFEAIKGVFESDDLYALVVSPGEAILVPKRVVSPEQEAKLQAFIMNVYPDKYKRI